MGGLSIQCRCINSRPPPIHMQVLGDAHFHLHVLDCISRCAHFSSCCYSLTEFFFRFLAQSGSLMMTQGEQDNIATYSRVTQCLGTKPSAQGELLSLPLFFCRRPDKDEAPRLAAHAGWSLRNRISSQLRKQDQAGRGTQHRSENASLVAHRRIACSGSGSLHMTIDAKQRSHPGDVKPSR
ncbi:unnamed protein product [Clonostachys rosea f. rosea IK726]|uniref:Uncharacterized protein n=2 Tax=Bionectria ochroleuca TaxID=29856 RepID=A0A0B7K2W3_BIOOC|nr:unnamed protein product [Clonostachys rosea f. rosea IK726]